MKMYFRNFSVRKPEKNTEVNQGTKTANEIEINESKLVNKEITESQKAAVTLLQVSQINDSNQESELTELDSEIETVEPETRKSAKPKTQDPVEPETQDTVEPVTQEPVEPETQEPVEPVTQNSLQPEIRNSLESETQEALESETRDSVEPEIPKSLKPETMEPIAS